MEIVDYLLRKLFGYEGPRTIKGFISKVKQTDSRKVNIFLEVNHTTLPALGCRNSTYTIIAQSKRSKFIAKQYTAISYIPPYLAQEPFIMGPTKEVIENKIEEVSRTLQKPGLETQILEPVVTCN